jgi:hypothetical protein
MVITVLAKLRGWVWSRQLVNVKMVIKRRGEKRVKSKIKVTKAGLAKGK